MKRRVAAHIIVAIALAWALPSLIMSEGFVAGTVIATSRGYVPIEDLQPGHNVLAADFTNSVTNDRVTHVYQHHRDALVRITIDHQTIIADADHLFFLPCTQRWVCAKELVCGDILLEGPLTAHQITGIERHEVTATCYSLSLATHHTYLVSQKNIVVHNCTDVLLPPLIIETAKSAPFLTAFLAANPWLVPSAILAGGAGLTGYLIWSLIHADEQPVKDAKNKNASISCPESSQQNKQKKPKEPKSDPNGVAAAALLKAIDESKEKAVEVFNKTCEWLRSNDGLQTVKHCFFNKPRHNFCPLLARMEANTVNEALNQARQIKILIDITQQLVDMGTRLTINHNWSI